MANEAQKQAFFRDWKDAPKDPAEALAFQQGWYKGYDAHESAIRTAAEALEQVCRNNGHVYFNPRQTGRRLCWTEAGWELEPHSHDDEPFTFETVIEALAAVDEQGEPLKAALATGKESLSPYHTIVPATVSATFVGHVNPPTDGKEKEIDDDAK